MAKLNTTVVVLAALAVIMIGIAIYLLSSEAPLPENDTGTKTLENTEMKQPNGLMKESQVNETLQIIQEYAKLPPVQIEGPATPKYSIVTGRIQITKEDIAGKYHLREKGTVFAMYNNKDTIGFMQNLRKGNYTLAFLVRATYLPPVKMHLLINDYQYSDVIVNAIDLWQGAEVYLGELEGVTSIKLVYYDDEAKFDELTGEYYDDRNVYLKDISLYSVQ